LIFKQYYLGCLAHASYLVGDDETHTAAVVDPQRDVEQYVRDAEQLGLTIRHVFLTHFHADFIAGHLELRDRLGCDIRLGSRAQAEYAIIPMKDGASVDLGSVRLQVMETPGHTPESISLLVFDCRKDEQHPESVLTGDTLFVGDVGRPDLRAALGWSAAELGGMLYDSLHQKLLALPDETRIFPAHGAGSLCGKQLSSENSSTIGVQRRLNYALQPMTREEFVTLALADQPDAPPYFTYDAVLNSKERPTLEKSLERALQPLNREEVLRLQAEGAQILDVRDAASFEVAHLAGSLNIGLGGQYATWAGTLLRRDRPIVIIAEPGRETEAETRLGRIGFDDVLGYLSGGMEALAGRPELLREMERLDARQLAEELAVSPAPLVLDVRSPRERQQAWIEGSVHIPLNHLRERAAEVPRARKIVVQCAGGYRSAMGASLLRQQGFENVADLAGGIAAWQAARLPVRTALGTGAV